MSPRCDACRFFESGDDECRRYAPRLMSPGLDFHNSELLRDIAWSFRQHANIEEPTAFDTVSTDAHEAAQRRWPYVAPDDWCGEFEARSDSGTS